MPPHELRLRRTVAQPKARRDVQDDRVGRIGGHVVMLEHAARLEDLHDVPQEPVAIRRRAADGVADAVEDAAEGWNDAVRFAHERVLIGQLLLLASKE